LLSTRRAFAPFSSEDASAAIIATSQPISQWTQQEDARVVGIYPKQKTNQNGLQLCRPKAYVELEVPKTLAEMSFKLRNGSIEVGLHEENRDHVFHLVNNKLGKPILLFPQGMSKLLTECLPKAYEIYDASEKDSENIDDGTIYSETLVLSKYVKNVVEVSVYKKQLYVFLKRLGKPDAMKKTSIYTGTIKAYTGPKIEPDKDGFIPMKSCSIQFDRETDDPAEILVWARKCMTIPF